MYCIVLYCIVKPGLPSFNVIDLQESKGKAKPVLALDYVCHELGNDDQSLSSESFCHLLSPSNIK